MKEPEKGTIYFEMLVLHTLGADTMKLASEGQIQLPADMLAVAVKTALKKFNEAVTATEFEAIVVALSDCRQILHDLDAKFKDIGIEESAVRELEEKLKLARKSAGPSRSYSDPDRALDITLKGINKLLPN